MEQNRRALKEVAIVRERYRISDRAGAAIATATLKAFEIETESESKYVIDRRKLRRERSKCREKSDWKKIVYLVLKLYIRRRKKRRYNKKQWTKRKVLSGNFC